MHAHEGQDKLYFVLEGSGLVQVGQERFEDAVGQACESAAARQVARRFGLAATTVRAIDLRYLERWAATKKRMVSSTNKVFVLNLSSSAFICGWHSFTASHAPWLSKCFAVNATLLSRAR